MKSFSESGPLSDAEQNAMVWSISFGDLLTLLVCFFFVLTPGLLPRQVQNVQNGALTSTNTPEFQSGTAFASSPLGVAGVVRSKLLVECGESSQAHNEAEQTSLAKAWADYRVLVANTPRDVAIRLCARAPQSEALELMLAEIERSKPYVRSWDVELYARCDESIESSSNEKQLCAVLEFSET